MIFLLIVFLCHFNVFLFLRLIYVFIYWWAGFIVFTRLGWYSCCMLTACIVQVFIYCLCKIHLSSVFVIIWLFINSFWSVNMLNQKHVRVQIRNSMTTNTKQKDSHLNRKHCNVRLIFINLKGPIKYISSAKTFH